MSHDTTTQCSIELAAHPHELAEEYSEMSLFSTRQLMSTPSPPEDPRLKTRALTYIRQNYLKLFNVLIMFILFLLFLNVIQLIRFRAATTTSCTDVPPSAAVYTVSLESDTTVVEFQEGRDERKVDKRRPCSRIHCVDTSCYPQNTDYDTLREYTCCSCVDQRFTFRRYIYDLLRDSVTLQFQVPEDISEVSARDLRNMPELPNLQGGWNLIKESPTAYYFQYQDVRIPEPPDSVN